MSVPAGDDIHYPAKPVVHRQAEYEEENYAQLLQMQRRHFWYLGRHRFLLHAVVDELRHRERGLRAIDLGGGCGGWLEYLHARVPDLFGELALADSSLEALTAAQAIVHGFATRYQVDLYDLGWEERWDVAFLLDVLEHLHHDDDVLRQIGSALRPGGLLFVTAPALPLFHSWNDELVHHLRRYTRADVARLARQAGLVLRRSRYFMFFLSPLLLARRAWPFERTLSPEDARRLLARTHAVPLPAINQVLRSIFSLETPLGWHLPFPWGTSVLAVFEKPPAARRPSSSR